MTPHESPMAPMAPIQCNLIGGIVVIGGWMGVA